MSEKNVRFEIIDKKRTKKQKLFYSLKIVIYISLIWFLIYCIILLKPFIFPIGGNY